VTANNTLFQIQQNVQSSWKWFISQNSNKMSKLFNRIRLD
jgi:hypothetical protein